MLQSEVLAILEELAPTALAAPWDNSGMQIAAGRKEIRHIAVSLDPSPESVRKALDIEADFIFTHHPILLSPKYLNNLEDNYYKVASLLLKNDIPLYSAHTCLDSMPVAFWFIEELEKEFAAVKKNILEPTGVIDGKEYGIGICAEFASPIPQQVLFEKLCRLIPHTRPFFRIGELPPEVKCIAVCGGSGSSLLAEAQKFGAQCLITGDTKYHTALDTVQENKNFALIEVGHHSLEEEMMRRFSVILQEKIPQAKISFIPSQDPFIQIME